MKPTLPLFALIATIAITTEATDPAALINLKSQIGNFLLNAATSAIQAKQNLVGRSTSALINAKTNFVQRQLPFLLQFNNNQINSLLEFKKNLIKSKAALLGQLFQNGGNVIQSAEQDIAAYSPQNGGNAIQSAEQDIAPAPFEEPHTSYHPYSSPSAAAPFEEPHTSYHPYSPPSAPAPFEGPHTSYRPQQPLQFSPSAAPPIEVPLGPYPLPTHFGQRQSSKELVDKAHAQPSFRPQRTPSQEFKYNKIQYSDFPTPPPPPPQYSMYV